MDLALLTKTQVSCIVPLLLLPVTPYSDLDYKAGDVRSPLCIGPGSPDCDIGVLPLKKERLLVEYGDIRIEYGRHRTAYCTSLSRLRSPRAQTYTRQQPDPINSQVDIRLLHFLFICFLTRCAVIFPNTQQHNW